MIFNKEKLAENWDDFVTKCLTYHPNTLKRYCPFDSIVCGKLKEETKENICNVFLGIPYVSIDGLAACPCYVFNGYYEDALKWALRHNILD